MAKTARADEGVPFVVTQREYTILAALHKGGGRQKFVSFGKRDLELTPSIRLVVKKLEEDGYIEIQREKAQRTGFTLLGAKLLHEIGNFEVGQRERKQRTPGPRAGSERIRPVPSSIEVGMLTFRALEDFVEEFGAKVDEAKAARVESINDDIQRLKAHIVTAEGDDLSNTATMIRRAVDDLNQIEDVVVRELASRWNPTRPALRPVLESLKQPATKNIA